MSNIINTKVKFSRNLKGVKFTTNMSMDEQRSVLKLCLDAVSTCGLKGEELSNMNDQVIDSLLSSGRVEKSFIKNLNEKGYASNDDVVVQINNLNHIEVFSQKQDVFSAYAKAKEIDKKLCNKLHFAYNDKYGFISPDMKNIGSGMQTSTVVMLPALTELNAVKSLPKSIEKLVFDIEQFNQNGMYLISNKCNLGYTEKQICELTKAYIDKVVKCEIEACKTVAKDVDEVQDKCVRAKAIINSCIKISPSELYDLVNDILIAINSGLEKETDANKIQILINCIKTKNEKELAKLIKNILK